jgi:PKD repeat protein
MNIRKLGVLAILPLLILGITACPGIIIDNIIIITGPNGLVSGAVVTFQASSPVADSQVQQYLWDFGDGSTGSGNPTSHVYRIGGTITVLVKIILTNGTFIEFTKTFVMSGNNQIAFICRSGPGNNKDLCLINADGSDLQVLHGPNDISYKSFQDPVINASGQIAFTCARLTFERDLCGINSDGSGFHFIYKTSGGVSLDDHDMNDFGQIAAKCDSSAPSSPLPDSICVINFDGSGLKEIGIGTDSADDSNTNPVINNLGQIAYVCDRFQPKSGICGINFDGSGFHVVAQDASDRRDQPAINNLGQVAYRCQHLDTFEGLCGSNFDGSGFRVIRDSMASNDEDLEVHINDLGQLVFECENGLTSSAESLCRINFNGSNFTVLLAATSSADNIENPAINNSSIVAFSCDTLSVRSLCSINFDGTNELILRDSGGDSDFTSEDPDIN